MTLRGTMILLALAIGMLFVFYLLIPKFQLLIPKSRGSTKGGLGAIRSSLAIYYGDHDNVYPDSPQALMIGGKYLFEMPKVQDTPHPPTNAVELYRLRMSRDTGRWGYVNNPSDAQWGTVFIDCTHTDSRGKTWSAF